METVETVSDLFWGAPKSLQMVIAAIKLKDIYYLEKSYGHPRQYTKKQGCYFANKVPPTQSYGFSSSHVRMRVGLQGKLRTEELMFLKCGVGEDSWESLGLQEDPTSPS